MVSAAFRATPAEGDDMVLAHHGLEPGYVLCLAPRIEQLPLLLAAWSWVEGSMGDSVPLVLVGLSREAQEDAEAWSRRLHMDPGALWFLNEPRLEDLPGLYRGATLFLHPGESETGQELRWALATGCAIAGVEDPATAAIVEQAAYLTAPGDARSLGSAILTLLVEEEMAALLRRKALLRARAYHGEAPLQAFLAALCGAAGP